MEQPAGPVAVTPSEPFEVKPVLSATESRSVHEAAVGVEKVVVAVHGIGDQYRNATIQTVVSAFGKFSRYPAAMPLGRFPGSSGPLEAFRLKGPPEPAAPLGDIGFVEVYWADIPRAVQKEGYIIEESKAWARTVVERVRARFGEYARDLDCKGPKEQSLRLQLSQKDYFAGADAIEEMIETFAVLDNLLFIAEKAGVMKFDLDTLLTQYLGDVQIVADFAGYRRTILDKFSQVLHEVHHANRTAEIYVVAHSEGTVVALMGLLEAMCKPPRHAPSLKDQATAQAGEPPGWVQQLRGFMTFGSPIDKHLVLWPDIWDSLQTPHPNLPRLRPVGAKRSIRWRNYYDYGDPVGFRLDTAREWMASHGWSPYFDFSDQHDYGFGRYLLPGAAHNEYWGDDAVFGHFIHTVMELPVPNGGGSFDQPPGDKMLKRLGSNLIPYLLVLGVLYLGVYLLYKGMLDFIAPETPAGVHIPIKELVLNVSGITAILGGMIALARIPRVTRSGRWIAYAIGIFAVGAAIYALAVREDVHRWHALKLFDYGHPAQTAFVRYFGEGTRAALKHQGVTADGVSAAFIILLAGAVAGFAAWGSRRDLRSWTSGLLATLRSFFAGARPLIIPGGLFVLVIVLYRAFTDKGGAHALWPLVLASAAFLYLWWLAILIFDLVFVWHRYIRFSAAHNYLYALRMERKNKPASIPPSPSPYSSGDIPTSTIP